MEIPHFSRMAGSVRDDTVLTWIIGGEEAAMRRTTPEEKSFTIRIAASSPPSPHKGCCHSESRTSGTKNPPDVAAPLKKLHCHSEPPASGEMILPSTYRSFQF